MVPPAARRTKRKTVQSSDDEWIGKEDIGKGSPPKKRKHATTRPPPPPKTPEKTNGATTQTKLALPSRTRTSRNTPRKPKSSTSTPNSSPEKAKTGPRTTKSKDTAKQFKSKSKPIYSFFNASTQRQLRSKSDGQRLSPDDELDDDIQDDSYDDEGQDNQDSSGSSKEMDKKKRKWSTSQAENHFPGSIIAGSQKFRKGLNGIKSNVSQKGEPTPRQEQEDLRPWAEKYAPTNLVELAVHSRKVADVRTWLENAFEGQNRKRLLILKGPSGTGKTTTMKLLSEVVDFETLEWRNPVGLEFSSEGFVSMSAQFEEFIGRGGKFGSLEFSTDDKAPEDKGTNHVQNMTPTNRKRVILVEEFPNTFTKSSTALQSFRSALQQFLASTTHSVGNPFSCHSNEPITPLVLIISETLLTTSTAAADSFTAHRLLGPEILNHPGVTLINFNPIAPTYLTKALELVVQKEARETGRKKTPGQVVLERLGEVGDIRSAVGSLEFLCLRGDKDGDWGGKVAFGKAKKKSVALTNMERESLELVTQREASLGIFHAVGRIVYNKREDDCFSSNSKYEPPPQPPEHLSQHARLKKSTVMLDELIDETGTDTQTFISALHENYILSCDILSSEASLLDSVNGCIDALSDSDLLCPNWSSGSGFGGPGGGFGRLAFHGAGADILRQDEISFQAACRGILFSLPYPVKRKSPTAPSSWNRNVGGGQPDAFKMFYPTGLKLWRQTEEIKGNVDLWIGRFMRGEVNVTPKSSSFGNAKSKLSGVESWTSTFKVHPSSLSSSSAAQAAKPDAAPALLMGGISAHREMTLERLPYMAKILARRNPTTLREIEKVTLFKGVEAQSEDIPDDDEEGDITPPVASWATDRATEVGLTPRKKKGPNQGRKAEDGWGAAVPVERVEKLILSDDDIEDD